MAISFSANVTVAPDVLFRLIGDEGVIVNLNTEQYLGVNAVGARIWHVLGEADSIEAACLRLQQEYEVPPAQLRADLEEFVGRLLAQKLIEIGSLENNPGRT